MVYPGEQHITFIQLFQTNQYLNNNNNNNNNNNCQHKLQQKLHELADTSENQGFKMNKAKIKAILEHDTPSL